MTAVTYHGLQADPLPGLPGWFSVRALGLHFRAGGPDGSPRCEVLWHGDGSARAELRGSGADGGPVLWSQDYGRGEPGWHPYRDVIAESGLIRERDHGQAHSGAGA